MPEPATAEPLLELHDAARESRRARRILLRCEKYTDNISRKMFGAVLTIAIGVC